MWICLMTATVQNPAKPQNPFSDTIHTYDTTVTTKVELC